MLEILDLDVVINNKLILDGITIKIKKGKIHGLVGPNGAGKTTLIKTIISIIKGKKGRVLFNGKEMNINNVKIGYMPDVIEPYDFMTSYEYLSFISSSTGIKKSKNKINKILELVGLNVDKKIGDYSRGMKQRLGLAQAIIGNPDILICDEPVSSLDPEGRREIYNIILSLKNEMVILISSHILDDVQHICDDITIINKGHVVVSKNIRNLISEKKQMKIIFKDSNDMRKLDFCGSKKLDETSILIENVDDKNVKKIFERFCELNVFPIHFGINSKSLEEKYMELINEDNRINKERNNRIN